MNEIESLKDNLKVQEKLMTTKEVASALGVTEKAIRQNAKRIGMIVKNGVPTYYTEEQATMIKSLIERSGRNDLNHVVQVENVSTELEMKQKAAEVIKWYMSAYEKERMLRIDAEYHNYKLNKELSAKNQQIVEDAPKVEFYNQVTDSTDCVDMGTVAKVLNFKNIGRTKLFEMLRNNGVLMSDNRPYQKYIDAGYFRVIESKYSMPDGTIRISFKTVVYQSGIDFIRKTINKQFKENLSNPVYMQNAIEDAAGKIAGEIA